MNKENLIESSRVTEFFVWIDEKDFLTSYHIKNLKSFTSTPHGLDDDLLTFIPNPAGIGFISPFQHNLLQDYWTEYNLELERRAHFKNYPSRLEGIYLFETYADAKKYQETHERHTAGRTLRRVRSHGGHIMSKHDLGWIDFLHVAEMMDSDNRHEVLHAYWKGENVIGNGNRFITKDGNFQPGSLYEILYVGRIDFLETLSSMDI